MRKILCSIFCLISIFGLCSFAKDTSNNSINNITIDNYESNYFGSNYVWSSAKTEVNMDDEIVKLIPKKLFTYENETLTILDEYAYYINTIWEQSFYTSNVMLIKIENSYLDEPSQIVQTIKPIFQAQYNYFSNIDGIINATYGNIYTTLTDVVLAVPKYDIDNGIILEETNNLYLVNPIFEGVLFNMQHLNSSEEQYDPNNDKGSFFVRSDLYYHGRKQDILTPISSICKIAISKIPIIKGVLNVGDVIDVFNAIDSLENIFDFDESLVDAEYGEMNKIIEYASAKEQVANYDGLIKYMYTGIDFENINNALLFSSNDYVTNKFTLSQTENWNTLFDSRISFSIYNSETNSLTSGDKLYSQQIRDNEYKNIKLNELTEAYNIGGYYDYFIFMPDYNGYYTIDNAYFDILTNGVVLDKILANYVYLEKDNSYIIKTSNNLINNDTNSYLIKIEVMDFDDYSLSINSNSELLLHKLLTPNFYNLTFPNGIGVKILDDSFKIISEFNNSGYFNLIKDDVYFLLKNNSYSSIKLSCTQNVITEVDLNQTVDKLVDEELFYKFVCKSSGYYYFSEFNNNTISFYYPGSIEVVSYSVRNFNGINRYDIYLEKNDTIYFGYNDCDKTNVSFNIKYADNYIDWYINESKISGNTTNVLQGDEIKVDAYIGDMCITNKMQMINSSNYTFNPSIGVLSIANNAVPSNMSGGPDAILISFEDVVYPLYIYIEANISLDLNIFKPSSLNGSSNNLLNYFTVSVNSKDINSTFKINATYTLKSGKIINLSSYYLSNDQVFNFKLTISQIVQGNTALPNVTAKFRINSIIYRQYVSGTNYLEYTIYNSLHNEVSDTDSSFILEEQTINLLFDSGTGISGDPFVIANEVQLNNINKAIYKYREDSYTLDYIMSSFYIANDITSSVDLSIKTPLKNASVIGNNCILNLSNVKNMFTSVTNSTIRNITFSNLSNKNSYLEGTQNIGIVANTISQSIIDNVDVKNATLSFALKKDSKDSKNTKDINYSYIGLICGMADASTFKFCDVNGVISAQCNIGGMIGYSFSNKIEYCNSNAIIKLKYPGEFEKTTKNVNVGGICAETVSGSIKNSSFGNGDGGVYFECEDYLNSVCTDDGEYRPYVACIVGTIRNNTTLDGNTYTGATMDSGILHSWSAWFQSWNQLEHFKEDEEYAEKQ